MKISMIKKRYYANEVEQLQQIAVGHGADYLLLLFFSS